MTLNTIDMVFPVAQRSEADGKNRIGLSAGQDEGDWESLGRGFGVTRSFLAA